MNLETNVQPVQEQQDLFTDQEIFSYEHASTGQRFLNYLIDALFMQYGLSFLTGMILAKILLAISPETAYDLFVTRKDSFDVLAAFYLVGILNYLIYYTICETAFKGKTLGKLITGTKAIREDGQELTFGNALLRSLCRMVPFEPLSIWFSDGIWHDRWTKTAVIKTR
jgi:uncharacterized RDD family membrane protein YckC